MANLINIRSEKFTKSEIKVIEDLLLEWEYSDLVEIRYFGIDSSDKLEVTFTLPEENLGEFLWVLFGMGGESAYRR